MRIALVSAHYPPNFVSGGTLVPQRIADGMAARGHEVSVFAGSYQDGNPDLTVRTEVTDLGVAIEWITITGLLGWDADTNYSNDAVSAEFARWLTRTRPEVVHFHSMQGLGGSLISTAAASGAVVVITMHDMWWWCARQFVVGRDLRPCSTVVDCGVCPCEVDNRWLRQRNHRLAAHLRNADLVLAPSSTMIEQLSANGVNPHKLELDENPAPESVRRAVHRTPGDGTVRFVFAGGSDHPLKGSQVAIEAARTLQDLAGWSLDLYGITDDGLLPERVQALPRYASDHVAQVLSRYDVLLMSSVAFESYSLLTREALAAGCAVITGDNPGPTEVVKDRVNGLVVPRGDAVAFGNAMRRLILDPTLLDTVMPTAGTLPLRRLDQQLDELERRFAELVAHHQLAQAGDIATPAVSDVADEEVGEPDDDADRPNGRDAGGPDRAESEATAQPVDGSETGTPERAPLTVSHPQLPPIQRVLIASGITGAPLRYRGYLAQEALATIGVRADVHMYRDVQVPRKARTADAVVLYRVPATDQVLDLVDMVRSRPEPVPVLFDIDDLVFDPGLRGELDPMLAKVPDLDLDLYWQGIRRYRTTLEACDAYIGSTEMLCERVAALTGLPAHRWANGVGRRIARRSDFELYQARTPGPIRIGYLSGTNTHNDDWAFVEPAIARVLTERPEVELWLGGLLEWGPRLRVFGDRIRRLPLKPWDELPAVLRNLDINLAPLEPHRVFNESKSAIKWLEAALTRTPTVASPSQPFREAIEHGVSGMLAPTLDDWVDLLLALIDDAAMRLSIGHRAHERALLELSPAQQGYRYLDILRRTQAHVWRHGHREQFADWTPETLSEPYILQAPDTYEDVRELEVTGHAPDGPPPPKTTWRMARDYHANATDYLRSAGPAATARKAARVGARISRNRATALVRRFR